MFTELTNLAPRQSIRAFRRSYFLRLATVATLLLCVIGVIHALLLMPSYLYAREEVKSETSQLQRLTNSAATTEEQSAQTQLNSLQSEATYLSRLSSVATASAAIGAILAVPHTGIALDGFSFTAPTAPGQNGTLVITGVAATRDTLRNYAAALSALPFVTNADLPISDYASDSAIAFTITLTGSLTP